MKYAAVATVEDRFVVEVEAANKAEADQKVRRLIESLDLTVIDLDEALSVRTIK